MEELQDIRLFKQESIESRNTDLNVNQYLSKDQSQDVEALSKSLLSDDTNQHSMYLDNAE